MRKRGADHQEIIIKRRAKKGHDDSHGGAWKVAFADFTMAMMALFMVLWIVQPQSKEESPTTAEMFANPLVDGGAGVFDGKSRSPLDLDGIPVQVSKVETQDNAAMSPQDPASEQPGAEAPRKLYGTPAELQALAQLMQSVASQLQADANIAVDVVPQGLRILLRDDQQRFMFERGSTRLTPHFRQLMFGLAQVLGKVENKLIISGHTDATPFRSARGYDNWNLSGDRALSARNALVESGMSADSVLQVTAHAERMPLRPEAPEDGVNRRVEVLLLTQQAELLYRQLFGDSYAQARLSQSGAHFTKEAGKPL
ncbi:putative flagellar export/assembly protein LafU [Pseudomonas sp. 8AS]|uniref:OmpA family protein n=1 Tax=Pseudomonas sp. 8AS TaxID=2653163 RepID=UPI0012F1912F|nr:OmpA family protein [Pseudomonas sp. 8AS]VXC27224.1 putative flagellar export/assembly protein LafU [Pseudomonas sp. 8AS]